MLLDVQGIDVFYEKLQALWDLSLKMDGGEMVALLGANGAGKSTVLRVVSGLQRAAKGKIFFQKRDISKDPPYDIVKSGISHVPEGRRIFAESTVLRNLEMGAYIRRKETDFHRRVEKCFLLFPILKDRLHQIAGTLSGGEQQMLAIARGLMSKPKLMMLDEPSLGLMPSLSVKVIEVLKRISSNGTTILLVEQKVKDALELADRAYVLQTGAIVMEGSGAELLKSDMIRKAYLGM